MYLYMHTYATMAIEQRDAYHALLQVRNSLEWRPLCSRRPHGALRLSLRVLSVIDCDGVFDDIRRYASHVILVYLKIFDSAWITSRRMQEDVRHRCPCCDIPGAADCLIQFFKGTRSAFLAGLTCGHTPCLPPEDSMSFLCLPRMHNCNIEHLYISFTVDYMARNTGHSLYYNNSSSE